MSEDLNSNQRVGRGKLRSALYGRDQFGRRMSAKDRAKLLRSAGEDITSGNTRAKREKEMGTPLRDAISKAWSKMNFSREARGSEQAKADTTLAGAAKRRREMRKKDE